MKAGSLRHKIILEQRATTRTSMGGVADTWTTLATVWGSIRPVSGREPLVGDSITAELTHTIRIRYRSDVTPKNRVKFGTRIFEINSVANIMEYKRELELRCVEVLA